MSVWRTMEYPNCMELRVVRRASAQFRKWSESLYPTLMEARSLYMASQQEMATMVELQQRQYEARAMIEGMLRKKLLPETM